MVALTAAVGQAGALPKEVMQTVVVRPLASRLIYAMLSRSEEYTDRGQEYFEERYRQRVLHNLAQRAKSMGMQLVPSNDAQISP